MPDPKHTLTGDDLAVAEKGAMIALKWAQDTLPKGKFRRTEIARFETLIAKLSAIHDHAYPYDDSVDFPGDIGAEPLMRLNAKVVRKTRADARAACAGPRHKPQHRKPQRARA